MDGVGLVVFRGNWYLRDVSVAYGIGSRHTTNCVAFMGSRFDLEGKQDKFRERLINCFSC